MGYRVDIRLIIDKRGYKHFYNDENNILNLSEVKRFDKYYYIKFNNIDIEKDDYIHKILKDLKKDNITYKIGEIGERTDDIIFDENISTNEKEDVPDIYVKREFDDNEIIKQLKKIKEKNYERT